MPFEYRIPGSIAVVVLLTISDICKFPKSKGMLQDKYLAGKPVIVPHSVYVWQEAKIKRKAVSPGLATPHAPPTNPFIGFPNAINVIIECSHAYIFGYGGRCKIGT